MKYTIQSAKYACWGHFPCHYRHGDACEYYKETKLKIEQRHGITQETTGYTMNAGDAFSLPCFELTEEQRQRGIPNMFR